LGIFSEFRQIPEGLQESFLYGVFGILSVAGDGLRDSEESGVVSLYEVLESDTISFLAGVD
jgi:hypothetical protein